MFVTNPEQLLGKSILSWLGVELAFASSNGIANVNWAHQSVPYKQFLEIELNVSEDLKVRIESGLDQNCNYYCLKFLSEAKNLELYEAQVGESIRVRSLGELPIGKIEGIKTSYNEMNNLVGITILINGTEIKICSGEILEKEANIFEIVKPQEFVLVSI
jgi:hypothetical protein